MTTDLPLLEFPFYPVIPYSLLWILPISSQEWPVPGLWGAERAMEVVTTTPLRKTDGLTQDDQTVVLVGSEVLTVRTEEATEDMVTVQEEALLAAQDMAQEATPEDTATVPEEELQEEEAIQEEMVRTSPTEITLLLSSRI